MGLKRANIIGVFGFFITTTSMAHASEVYGVFEVGHAAGRFYDAEVTIPSSTTTSSAVVDDTDHSLFAAIGIGYYWESKPLRTEIVYRKLGSQEFVEDTVFTSSLNERTTVNVEQESLMINLLYDFENNSDLIPYVGFGIGGSRAKISAMQYDYPLTDRFASFAESSDTNFAWNFVVGTNYNVFEKMAIGLGYRFISAGKVSTADNCIGSDLAICDENEKHSADLKLHSLFLNVNYQF
ncbi:outer membrane beta-barrel protein [Vibrio kasasachensis]|uniref:outer membrane protein n=1 Tax=Vibrio kasasachensis TaxID=2910248 RepID=UPI003D102187